MDSRSLQGDSDLKVHALHYANELLVRVRLAFQKLLQTSQTSRNNKKLSKTGFVYDKALFGKLTNKLDTGVNSSPTELFSAEQTQKFTRETSRRADFIHSQREIKEIFAPEKHTFSIKSEHKST